MIREEFAAKIHLIFIGRGPRAGPCRDEGGGSGAGKGFIHVL
jgi:hypothetical protein